MTLVLDASVTMAWCFEDEVSAIAETVLDRLREEDAVVPALWPVEVSNVVLVAERRGRMTEAQAERFVRLLAQLPISVDTQSTDLAGVLSMGRRYELSAYDASYLLLAARLGVPLASLDTALVTAARTAGVKVITDPE